MEQNTTEKGLTYAKSGLITTFLWIMSLIFVGFFSFIAGQNTKPSSVISAPATPTIVIPDTVKGVSDVNISPSPQIDLNGICAKSGLSQKSEFLTPYTIQDGDSLVKIAETQLKDASRVNEITQLNGNTSGLSAGSVLYLPPLSLPKSSGNLAQVSGMIIKKDNATWQLSYGGGAKGLGIVIPAYYFSGVENKDDFKIGDCVTVFLDDGVKVYTVTKQ